jgi:ribosomal protein L11 methylase PrmA
MNNKHISKTIVYSFVAAFMLGSLMLIDNNRAFAFFGFNLFGTGDEEQTSSSTTSQSSSSLQNAQCHSPTDSVIDSCNSGDLSDTENTGYNTFGQ